jgi:hypothetical protein
MGTFGITDFNEKALPMVTCPDGTKDIANGVVAPCMGRDGKKPIGYIIPMSNRDKPETFTNVRCNDGSTQSVGSNPSGGRVDVPCKNNGGVSKNQQGVNEGKPNLYTVTDNEPFLQKHKNHLIIAVVLVAGYFAYKKFKK